MIDAILNSPYSAWIVGALLLIVILSAGVVFAALIASKAPYEPGWEPIDDDDN